MHPVSTLAMQNFLLWEVVGCKTGEEQTTAINWVSGKQKSLEIPHLTINKMSKCHPSTQPAGPTSNISFLDLDLVAVVLPPSWKVSSKNLSPVELNQKSLRWESQALDSASRHTASTSPMVSMVSWPHGRPTRPTPHHMAANSVT